ncbi:ryncolin-1-like [Dysidea avara]|uniref:ryncolin-1-like n=1 Tax=Dysidea avara TaxID=196820 RepID=UPI00332CD797
MMMFITIVLLLVMVTVDGCPVASFVNESCCEVKGNEFKFSTSLKSHVYNITNFCGDCELVAEGYCDAITAGGGWLVIQRRQDGSVDFNRDWIDYEDGFGSLTGEFWYGLRAIHCLTNRGQWELRIDYTFTNGTKGYLSYSNFSVGPATEQYLLTISGFDGVTDDPFYTIQKSSVWSLNGWKFTTRDRDNDRWSRNCAVHNNGLNGGGWWYNHCSALYLNHRYNYKYTIHLNGQYHPLPFIEIKIRPKDCII